MIIFRLTKLICLVSLLLLATGCANQSYSVKPKLVETFTPIEKPSATETYVYVIRCSQFKGAGRNLQVGVNKSIHAEISNGSHTFLKLKNGNNTVSLVQSGRALAHTDIGNRAGEIVFMYVDYETGVLYEAKPNLGKSMVQETQYIAAYETPKLSDTLIGIRPYSAWLEFGYMSELGSN